jgi:hypothetical protein
LLCSAIVIASLKLICRVGLAAVFALPTVAEAAGAFVVDGVWAKTQGLANSATTKAIFRIERRSMVKLIKFVKAMIGLPRRPQLSDAIPRPCIQAIDGLTRDATV